MESIAGMFWELIQLTSDAMENWSGIISTYKNIALFAMKAKINILWKKKHMGHKYA